MVEVNTKDELIGALEIVEKNKLDDETMFSIAKYHFKNRNYKNAYDYYRKILKLYETDKIDEANRKISLAALYNNAAVACYRLGINRNLVREYYKKAFQLEPKDNIVCMNYVRDLIYKNRNRDARQVLITHNKLVQEDFETLHMLYEIDIKLCKLANTRKDERNLLLTEAIKVLTGIFDNDELFNELYEFYPEEAYLISYYCMNENAIFFENEMFIYLSDIFNIVKSIKENLVVDIEHLESDIVHYTSLNTLKVLALKDNAKFRVSNATYLNDPTEGKIFHSILEKLWDEDILNSLYQKDNHTSLRELNYNNTYIASFTSKNDYLPMWTLYGDDAKGCAIAFDKDIFNSTSNMELENIEGGLVVKQNMSHNYNLYRVMYIDDVEDLPQNIKYELEKIEKILLKIKANEDLITYDLICDYTRQLLEQIRYLFKTCDYQHEEEMRIVLFCGKEEAKEYENVEGDMFPKLYTEIDKELRFDDVILGSKVKQPLKIAQSIFKHDKVGKVYMSNIKYQ